VQKECCGLEWRGQLEARRKDVQPVGFQLTRRR
jgi:hypothetical protein